MLTFKIFIKVLNKLEQEQKTGKQAPKHITLVRNTTKGHFLELESKEAFLW